MMFSLQWDKIETSSSIEFDNVSKLMCQLVLSVLIVKHGKILFLNVVYQLDAIFNGLAFLTAVMIVQNFYHN